MNNLEKLADEQSKGLGKEEIEMKMKHVKNEIAVRSSHAYGLMSLISMRDDTSEYERFIYGIEEDQERIKELTEEYKKLHELRMSY